VAPGDRLLAIDPDAVAARIAVHPWVAKVIVRRRVIDLLRKDARQTNHCSLPSVEDPIETDKPRGSFDDLVQRDPRAQLELRQVIQMVRDAVACFATQGRAQQRQAQLSMPSTKPNTRS